MKTIQGKISHTQSDKSAYLEIPKIGIIGKFLQPESRIEAAWVWGEREGDSDPLLGTEFLFGLIKLQNRMAVIVVKHCECN